jgi:hypothetical protein
MTDLEIVDVLTQALEYQRVNGYQVYDVQHNGKDRLYVELTRPGGGAEFITLAIVDETK